MEDQIKLALSILKQNLTTVLAVTETESLELERFSPEKAEWLRNRLRVVDGHGRRIRHAFFSHMYGEAIPLIQASTEHVSFFEKEYLPRADDISNLVIFGHANIDYLAAELGIEPTSFDLKTSRDQHPLWSIFESGMDQIDMFIERAAPEDTEHLDEDDVARTKNLLNSAYFKPDDWVENLDALSPIISPRSASQLPQHIRIRVREVYASFVFGNWLSVLSSARALLEYALLDRHSPLGFTAYKTGKEGESPRPLSLIQLVENASTKLPEIDQDMHHIRTDGNEVMHPKSTKKHYYFPAERNQALGCIARLRTVLQALYA